MWQPGWERGLGENGFMYMCGWVPLLSTWNYPNVVNWRYSNIKLTAFKTVTVPQHSNIRFSRGGMTWLTHWHMHPSLELKEYAEMNRSICWQCVNFAPKKKKIHTSSLHCVVVQSLSHVRLIVTPSCPTLCHPMACSTPGFPVLHCLLEFAWTYVHWVNDAIQPSHLLSPSSPSVLNLFQHQNSPKYILNWKSDSLELLLKCWQSMRMWFQVTVGVR